MDSPVDAQTAARRPYLHDKVSCVRAPTTWVSSRDGQVLDGFDGLYTLDRRFLTRLVVAINGERPTGLSAGHLAAAEAEFVGVLTSFSSHVPDPSLMCVRRRGVDESGGYDRVTVTNLLHGPVALRIEVEAGCDMATLTEAQTVPPPPLLPAAAVGSGLRWRSSSGYLSTLTASAAATSVAGQPESWQAPVAVDPEAGTLCWQVDLGHGEEWTVELRLTVAAPLGPRAAERARRPAQPAAWDSAPLSIDADDRRVGSLVRQSLADLDALRLADPADGHSEFFAAGSPWFMTLFGRDSLWSAMMGLPLGTELMLGTLRALARRQGIRVVAETDEAPGKILHELRLEDSGVWQHPVIYGTIDATPLFVTATTAAWRWGAPTTAIASLLPAVEAALHWLRSYADGDGDGFVEYAPNRASLTNQGWKDSFDGIQWADGTLATGPISLSEVQAYAYRAALDGADLLEAFGRPGAQDWRAWAAAMAERFGPAYLIADADGPYPAIGLDRDKRPITGPASNMGHLVGTGLVGSDLERAIADRLTGDALSSGFGLRTMASTASGFNPLGYHTGSVWPHDNAIAALGLTRAGLPEHAMRLIDQLLDVAPDFGFRLPELFGGHRARVPLPPVPYPPSCRPQAWTAAFGPALVQILLGLRVDVPGGVIELAPVTSSTIGAYRVRNVRIGTGLLSLDVGVDGQVVLREAPPGVRVIQRPATVLRD